MLGDGFLGLPHTVEALRGRRRRRDDTQRGRGSRPQVAKMPLLPSMLTSWKSDVVGAMKWMRDIPARTAVCTAAVIECDLPAPRPPRNSQHHDRSGGGSCASRAAKTQSSAASSPSPRISFLRCHLIDVLAQLVHALNFTQKKINHRRRPSSRRRLRCRDLLWVKSNACRRIWISS